GGVLLSDANSGALLRGLGQGGDRGIASSADGRMIAVVGFHMDQLVSVYDVQMGKLLQVLQGHSEWEALVVAASLARELVVSAARNNANGSYGTWIRAKFSGLSAIRGECWRLALPRTASRWRAASIGSCGCTIWLARVRRRL